MRNDLLLAIDIGTTNSKGALFTTDGKLVYSTSRRHSVISRQAGWAEHDAEENWWHEFCEVCIELTSKEDISASDIRSVAISSLSPALVPIDAQGRALYPAMLYGLDRRAVQEIADLKKQFADNPEARITPLSTGPKILWLKRNEPEIFNRAAKFVGVPTFLVNRLTGNTIADYGRYKIAGFPFSFARMDWVDEMCDACGISRDKLPELKFAAEQAGSITSEASACTGLPVGTPVAVGTSDFLAESLSFGTTFPGMTQMSFGTTVGVDFGNDHCAILFSDFKHQTGKKHTPGGAMSNGCSTIDWIISMISGVCEGKRPDNEMLREMAVSVPAGSNGITILPYFNGEKLPILDPLSRGMIFGLQTGHTQADLFKASLESLAYSIRHFLDKLAPDDAIREAVVMGGGTNIPMLLQTISNVTGYQLTKLSVSNGTLLGNILIAGMACGIYKNREVINSWIDVEETILPDKDIKEIYDKGFQTYLDLYKATAEIMHR